jgi:hypothetical protein
MMAEIPKGTVAASHGNPSFGEAALNSMPFSLKAVTYLSLMCET